jgi:hypothetical protein
MTTYKTWKFSGSSFIQNSSEVLVQPKHGKSVSVSSASISNFSSTDQPVSLYVVDATPQTYPIDQYFLAKTVYGRFLKSLDGMNNWTVAFNPNVSSTDGSHYFNDVTDVYEINGNLVAMANASNKLLFPGQYWEEITTIISYDFGNTWKRLSEKGQFRSFGVTNNNAARMFKLGNNLYTILYTAENYPRIFKSTDFGVTWSTWDPNFFLDLGLNSDSLNVINDVAYLTSGSTLYTTSDFITFSTYSLPEAITSIKYGNGQYVAITGGLAYASTDLTNWTEVFDSSPTVDASYINGRWVYFRNAYVGPGQTASILYTEDGYALSNTTTTWFEYGDEPPYYYYSFHLDSIFQVGSYYYGFLSLILFDVPTTVIVTSLNGYEWDFTSYTDVSYVQTRDSSDGCEINTTDYEVYSVKPNVTLSNEFNNLTSKFARSDQYSNIVYDRQNILIPALGNDTTDLGIMLSEYQSLVVKCPQNVSIIISGTEQ